MKRVVLITLVVAILSSVLVGGHLYLIERLLLDPEVPTPARTFLTALILLLGSSLVLQPIAERTFPAALRRWIAWPASLWMGFAFVLLTLVAFSDLLQVLTGAAFAHAGGLGVQAARGWAAGIVVLGLVAGGAGIRDALRGPVIRRVEIRLKRWPRALDGFRIVQLSDIHIGSILGRRFAADLVARCDALAPDLIAVTGDLVDGSVERIGAEVQPFAALRARCGVFFVTGNHDYYSGADAWAERVAQLGIHVLRNQRVAIGEGAASFDLAGVEDHHAHLVSATHREDLPAALAERDPGRPVVLLAHDPATFTRAAALGVDLQLSGHTHGGQIWPFCYVVRLATPFVAGHYRRNGAQLYVSRGTGFWGPAMRLFAPAEITEILIRCKAGAEL